MTQPLSTYADDYRHSRQYYYVFDPQWKKLYDTKRLMEAEIAIVVYKWEIHTEEIWGVSFPVLVPPGWSGNEDVVFNIHDGPLQFVPEYLSEVYLLDLADQLFEASDAIAHNRVTQEQVWESYRYLAVMTKEEENAQSS